MSELLFELPRNCAARMPEAVALRDRGRELNFRDLALQIERAAHGLIALGLARGERVGIYLPKQFEAVVAMFGAARAGGVFVPINSALKALQVGYIMRDCDVRVLVTSAARLESCEKNCARSGAARCGDSGTTRGGAGGRRHQVLGRARGGTDRIVASCDRYRHGQHLLYVGRYRQAQGRGLSHKNMVTGAYSVAGYLGNTAGDRVLAVLPLGSITDSVSYRRRSVLARQSCCSSTCSPERRAAGVGARTDYWPRGCSAIVDPARGPVVVASHCESFRYVTNSGGAMPKATLARLRANLPQSEFFFMYGLTEAFRSTFLPPAEVERRLDSIGKAIPNAEIMVLRPDGTPCDTDEPGELVHRGSTWLPWDTGTIR